MCNFQKPCRGFVEFVVICASRFVLLAVPVGFAFICFVLKGYVQRGKKLLNWLLLLSASLFGISFLPWFFYVSLLFLLDWVKIVLVISILFLWISFPLVRRNATLMVVIYLYSFTIHSRVFRRSVFGISYTKKGFNYLLAVSIILLRFNPLIETIQRSPPHLCVRWIIQKGFYYPQTVGKYGCSGISWRNLILFCPASSISGVQRITSRQALTLDDVDDLTPIYIACTTVNRWRRTPSPSEPHCEVLTMSPHGIERLHRCPNEQELHGKLFPEDIYAAAMLNAAVSYDMGVQQSDEAPSRDLKVILGLSAGASIVADQRHENKRHFCVKNLPVLIEFLRLVPLALILTLFAKIDKETVLVAGMLIHFGISLIFSLLALVPTWGKMSEDLNDLPDGSRSTSLPYTTIV